MKFRPGGFFDLLFNIELKKVGVKIFREISYFSSPNIKHSDLQNAARRLLSELDLDRSQKISLEEFEYFVTKCPDFVTLFSTRQKTR